jgi:hypothetical protein
MTTNPAPNIPPTNHVPTYLQQHANACEVKQIYRDCPVTDACLDVALAHDERFGIWGGLSEQERHQLNRNMLDGTDLFNDLDRTYARRAG